LQAAAFGAATGWSHEADTVDNGLERIAADHYRCEVVVVNTMGLHARPATLFVRTANQYQSEVTIRKGDERVDGKSILQLLTLQATAGTRLVLEVRGADALPAIQALGQLITAGFEEQRTQ
jgi:phosphocarrier protein